MHQTDEIKPIVPILPTADDQPRRGSPVTRPVDPDCSPEDHHREFIEPLVPDLS